MTTEMVEVPVLNQDSLARLPLEVVFTLPPQLRRMPKVRARIENHKRGLRSMMDARLVLARQASAAGDAQAAGRHFRAAKVIGDELAAVPS